MRNKFNSSEYYSLCGWLKGINQPLLTCVARVMPSGNTFYPYVAKSLCVQNFPRFPSHFAHNCSDFAEHTSKLSVRAMPYPYS